MGKTSFDKIQISLNFKVKVIFHVIFLDKINMKRTCGFRIGQRECLDDDDDMWTCL